MVSVQFKQERHNALVSFLMIVIAVLFLLYMGSSLVNSTRRCPEAWAERIAGELYPDFLGKLFHREFIGMTFCRQGTESRVLSVFCNIYPYRE